MGPSHQIVTKNTTTALLFPALIFVILAVVFIGLWGWDRRAEGEALHARAERVVEQAAIRLEMCVDARLQGVELMSNLWSAGKVNTKDEFTDFALEFQRSFDGLLAINWIDPEGVIRWVVPAEPNKAAIGRNVFSHPVAGVTLRQTIEVGGLHITPPIELFQGGRGVAAYLPLARNGTPNGFLNIVFRTTPMLTSCLKCGPTDIFSYAVHDDGKPLFVDENFARQSVTVGAAFYNIEVGQRRWRITLFPQPAVLGWFSARVPEIMLAISMLVAFSVAWLVRRGLTSRAALKARTSEMQAIYQAYPDLQFRLALDGTILSYQVDGSSDLYVSPEQFLGKRMQDVLPAALGKRFEQAFRDVRERGSDVSLEYSLELTSGNKEFEARVLPLKDDEIIVIAREITERKQVEARLKSNQFAIEHGSEPIYWVREDGGFSYANQAACRSLGYTFDELCSMTASDIDPGFPAEDWPEHWAEFKERGSMTFESHHQTRDGHVFPVEITTNHVEFKGDEYVWAYVRDLTERQRAEEDHRQLEEQLRQSQKLEAVGQLAGGVAHEFNNMLTVILGCGEIVLEELQQIPSNSCTTTIRTNIEEIASAGQRGAVLTRQLLAFSRKEVDAPTVIDPAQVVIETERMLRHLVREDISIEVALGNDLAHIRAGNGQLEQVIVNLVLNACDAMPEGGQVRIDCGNVMLDDAHVRLHPGARAGRHVKISVRDNGVGMESGVASRVFEPFYTTKPVGKGTGLGLATVYGYVTSAGGHLTLDSTPGEGSTFTVYYPAVVEEAKSAEVVSLRQPIGNGEVILVCEDNPAVRRVTVLALRSGGFHPLEAENGEQALKVASDYDGKIDLLLTDVVMPEMNGPVLAETLLETRRSMRVLFVSGYSAELTDPQEARAQGHEFLAKPFSPRILLERVHELFARSGDDSLTS